MYIHTHSLSLSKVKKLEKKINSFSSGIQKKDCAICILKQAPLGFKAQETILVRNKPEIAGSIPASVILSLSLYNNDLLSV